MDGKPEVLRSLLASPTVTQWVLKEASLEPQIYPENRSTIPGVLSPPQGPRAHVVAVGTVNFHPTAHGEHV